MNENEELEVQKTALEVYVSLQDILLNLYKGMEILDQSVISTNYIDKVVQQHFPKVVDKSAKVKKDFVIKFILHNAYYKTKELTDKIKYFQNVDAIIKNKLGPLQLLVLTLETNFNLVKSLTLALDNLNRLTYNAS